MSDYKISVITPIYNGGDFLYNLLESLKNQTFGFENIEVILVNNNSTDNTKSILDEFDKEYDNCVCLNLKTHSGTPSVPLNEGLNIANGEYIMFLDCDDTYNNDMCYVMYETIKKYDSDFVMCNHDVITNGISSIDKNLINTDVTMIDTEKELTAYNYIYRWDKIFSKKFINENNIRNPENCAGEDSFFCISAWLYTKKEVPYLENFYGYNYSIRDTEGNSSYINTANMDIIINILKGFSKIADILKEENRDDLIKIVFESHLKTVLTLFSKLDETKENKILVINKIYDFEKYLGVKLEFDEFWASKLNKYIVEKKYSKALLFTKILKALYTNQFIRKIYRNK